MIHGQRGSSVAPQIRTWRNRCMPYAYYAKLSPRDKATYRKSDRLSRVNLKSASALWPACDAVGQALQNGHQGELTKASQRLVNGMVADVNAPPVRVKVLSSRPSDAWGELHGLYEPSEAKQVAVITVWMRTAAHKKTVAFKTFLRTLLHEMCHHLDYECLKLEESFHTQGFFKRESSLFHQLITDRQEKKKTTA